MADGVFRHRQFRPPRPAFILSAPSAGTGDRAIGEESSSAGTTAGFVPAVAYALAGERESGRARRPELPVFSLRALDGEVPHLAFPLRLGPRGSLATVEQDTLEDVRQCIHVLTRTPQGARPLAPQIGVVDPTFTGVDPDDLVGLLEQQEDRARVTVEVGGPDESGRQVVAVRVALAAADDELEA